ncbi:alpha/beta hydrolase family protein [Rosistilla ulvae]|nr:alpha/beta hydrolase [Rosistilla ulvae]
MNRTSLAAAVAFFSLAILAAPAGFAQSTTAAPAERKTQWNGYDQLHFQVAERNAYVVVPKQAAPGNPWVWRARFPGYHAEADIQLVANGFHIGYVDVAGMFGSPKAIEIGNQFYRQMTEKRGLAKRVALEAVSRGGLFAYNWAVVNLDHVACIYCDTPVCDFKSWPGGMGEGVGSAATWQSCLAQYGFDEKQAAAFKGNPIDHAEKIAAAKIPLLHIVSENDRVVPPKENTYLLRERLRAVGHDMEVISVPMGTEKSSGHHFPHPAVDQVVAFIQQHAAVEAK